MPAYLIVEIKWHDAVKQKEYREKLAPILEKHGGRVLYAGEAEVLEGSWKPPRVVLLEFPSMESLRGWYASDEYAPLIRIRKEGAMTNLVAVGSPAR
ncbi:MAG TPA: DUF1330 domain-containing protein [Thermoplasmata archaeon]|nr:DUF1330 domain-containing protein [Thermoplasmata archaeon]